MIKIISFMVFYLFISVLSTPLHAKEKLKMSTIACLTDGLDDIKYKEIRLAFDLWNNEVVQNQNIEVKTLYYSDHTSIIKDFKNHIFETLRLNPIYYLQYQEDIDLIAEDYYIMQRAETHYEKMLLLVRNNSGIKNLEDLKDKVIGIKNDSYQAEFFLNKEMLEYLHRDSNGYIKEFKKTKKYTTALLNVFFKKVDACIVPEYVVKLVNEMNPLVGKVLIPIVQSQNIFMPSMAILHKDTPPFLKEMYRKNITNLEETVRGKNILTLFKIKRIRLIKLNELKALKAYYKEYLALQKKYRVDND